MLKSLNHIIDTLNQRHWQGPQQFQRLLNCWADVVGAKVAQQTRPQAILADVLYVAASSPTWSQELKFKRHQILKVLNTRLSSSLVDIRFSSAQWYPNSTVNTEISPATLWQEHPSQVSETELKGKGQAAKAADPQAAFGQWAAKMQARSLSLPLCPQCQCPTPPGELQRWQVCGLCAAKQWHP